MESRITNNSNRNRKLSAFGFIEFTNEGFYENDLVNLQYTLFITKTYLKGNKILQTVNENDGKDKKEGTNYRERFFGMVGAPITSYNGNKSSFIGSYRSYNNPIAVERGKCDNVLNYNSNACGALHTDMVLQPGETKEFAFIMGQKNDRQATEILNGYSD